ncbi:ABC transporter G family member 23-like isoform X3 [Dermacentor albipictus]|uniref:ABC transporter G family member 23-like isoform X3 n=1 Tax=Dermacentor albipictus TaxID=60249 RepID=UPI0031FDF61B
MGPSLAAVAVRDLRLSYSRSSPPVIDGANMTIPKGAIYGLLGASGCGKTSLLKCLVGLSKPDSGAVLIFGQQLHEGLVPGPGVGFMPQELALHSDFTIAENMYFFGQLLGMPLKKIYERIAFLCSFFQLLPANRFVEHLSGGQQRRVSLAVALMHQPPFLILDEPTVGLDPVLREAIWRYFLVLSEENGVTLLVTTHFIEEIAKAAMVGVMKNGKIWCELPPTELMETYGAATLAESYLKVCQALDFPPPPAEKQAQPIPEKQKPQPVPEKPQPEPLRRPRLAPATPVQPCPVPESLLTWANWGPVRSCLRLRALVVKNLLKIMRRVITVVFQLVVPSCVGVVFCLFVGGKPSNLPVGVVNEDQHGAFSRAFLGEVSNETVVQKPYSDLHKAFSAVLDEQAWGTLHIPANYTIALNTRVHSGKIEDSSPQIPINFFLDATDYTIRNTLQFEIVEAHSRYLKLLSYNLTSLNFSVQTIRFTDPFYNAFDFTFREFMSPGIIVSRDLGGGDRRPRGGADVHGIHADGAHARGVRQRLRHSRARQPRRRLLHTRAHGALRHELRVPDFVRLQGRGDGPTAVDGRPLSGAAHGRCTVAGGGHTGGAPSRELVGATGSACARHARRDAAQLHLRRLARGAGGRGNEPLDGGLHGALHDHVLALQVKRHAL